MNATAVVPVKRFPAAKRRLAEALEPAHRAGLVAAMLRDVLAAIGRAEAIERTIVVSAEPEARRLAAAAGATVLADPPESGHSPAAVTGVAEALSHRAPCAVLLPGDCPLLDPAELDAAIVRARPRSVGVIADRHGTGTNGLVLRPPDAIEPSFGPGSCERHLRIARQRGLEAEVLELPSLGLDLDTPDDLDALTHTLADRPSLAPATAAAIAQLLPQMGGAG